MADSPKTSFIPKQDVGSAPSNAPKQKKKRTFNIFNFLSMVVFLGAIILAVGVYFLETRSEAALETNKNELNELKASFSRGDIETLRELDRRIEVGETLLSQHLSPSLIFDMLERRTQDQVQFEDFSYVRNESGTAAVSLSGVAPRFNTVALQARNFGEESVFERAIFSDLNISFVDGTVEEGGPQTSTGELVSFSVTGKINTRAIPFTVQSVNEVVDETTDTESATSTNGSAATSTATSTQSSSQ